MMSVAGLSSNQERALLMSVQRIVGHFPYETSRTPEL
jgi:hypothetical protein